MRKGKVEVGKNERKGNITCNIPSCIRINKDTKLRAYMITCDTNEEVALVEKAIKQWMK